MTTEELVKKYEEWLESWVGEFRLVIMDLNQLDPQGNMVTIHGDHVYTPEKKLFMHFYNQLQFALSRSPAKTEFKLSSGYYVVNWLWGMDDRYYGECVASGMNRREFASLFKAIAACPGYPNTPSVFKNSRGFAFMG